MKKSLAIIILTLIIIGSLQAETKFKMELWNRWTYQMSDGKVTKNEMALKRGYFRLEPKFNEDIKGRFNLDFFSDDDSKVADGAGLKIKYAYIDFNNLLTIKDLKLSVGLMQTYFGTIYEWSYPTIEGDPSDIYKFVSSTDFGFGVSGKIPNEFGSFNLCIYNGEGYKNVGGNINTDMNYAANLRITTFNSVMVGASYMFRSKKDSDADDREECNLFAGIGKFTLDDFSVLTEYLYKLNSKPNSDVPDETTSVFSILPVYKINDKFELLARYDIYDPDIDADNDVENTLSAGMNYHIMRDANNAPKLFVQMNYKNTQYEADIEEDVQEILMQLRWIFSEIINKN